MLVDTDRKAERERERERERQTFHRERIQSIEMSKPQTMKFPFLKKARGSDDA